MVSFKMPTVIFCIFQLEVTAYNFEIAMSFISSRSSLASHTGGGHSASFFSLVKEEIAIKSLGNFHLPWELKPCSPDCGLLLPHLLAQRQLSLKSRASTQMGPDMGFNTVRGRKFGTSVYSRKSPAVHGHLMHSK